MGPSSLEQLAHRIQISHPEEFLGRLPGIDDQVLAAIVDVDAPTFRTMRDEFRRRARDKAFDLLCDPIVEGHVDQLPVRQDAVIVGLGDRFADYCQSWLDILRYLLELRRPEARIRVINAGFSRDTTSQMISRFLGIVHLRPDWIICAAGTNDARRHGRAPTRTLLSIEETGHNLKDLRGFAAAQTRARWIWMTPAPVIEARIIADWFLGPQQLTWRMPT